MKALMRVLLAGFLLSSTLAANAAQCHAKRVIYMTWDGTAPYEVTSEHFPYLFSKVLPHADFLGTYGGKRLMTVASIPLSYPSYLSQMTGKVGPCMSNDCPRVDSETLPEELKRRLQLDKSETAVFASWEPIQRAVEHIKGNLTVDSGEDGHTRADDKTFLLAYDYLTQIKPTFLWLSLDASDHYAHQNDRANFEKTLHEYDGYFHKLIDAVNQDPCMDDTWFVVTTDHGRGLGKNWTSHGVKYPFSKFTWMVILHAKDLQTGQRTQIPYDMTKASYSTKTVRPLVKSFFNVD